MKKLLWVGDACVSSGFARATHNILDTLRYVFDVQVLGLCYSGDPHDYPYKVYPAYSGGDAFGVGRVKDIAESFKPDVIVIQQDPWNFPPYLEQLKGIDAPIVGHVAVDGKNCAGEKLQGLAACVFWTMFGEAEAKVGGYVGPTEVIPLGVDRNIYKPLDKIELKANIIGPVLAVQHLPADSFVVGVVGRNQERKRLDLTIRYFAEWVRSHKVEDACLWCHVAPTGDQAYDMHQLVKYYGMGGRVFAPSINPVYGLPEASMAKVINLFDVFFSTTQGEGFGLPALEAMACGVPPLLPDWSAYGDWARRGATLVPCSSTAVTPHIGGAVLGGIMDEEKAIEKLHCLYAENGLRARLSRQALDLASQPEFQWPVIGDAWLKVLSDVLQNWPGLAVEAEKDAAVANPFQSQAVAEVAS
jgi:glycosyltransferase involved in cell wall biosynthesis